MNGGKFAAKHTREEWEKIGVKGMQKEIKKICPNYSNDLKEKYIKDVYEFVKKFAKGSGNIPSC